MTLEYPNARAFGASYLEALADRKELEEAWLSGEDRADTFDWTVEELFDVFCPVGLDKDPGRSGAAVSIGEVLLDQAEADAVNAVLRPLDGIVGQLDWKGPELDRARQTLAHPDWPQIERAAARAVELIRRNDKAK